MSTAAPCCRRLASLTTPELFLLCSLRLAADAVRNRRKTHAAYQEGFDRARLTPVLAERLSAAMVVIHVAAARSVHVHPLQCGEISPDEDLLLRLVRLLQEEDEFSARRLAWQLLPPGAARVALDHLDALAIGMTRAGLHLPDFRPTAPTCPAEALAARRLAESAGFKTARGETSDVLWMN